VYRINTFVDETHDLFAETHSERIVYGADEETFPCTGTSVDKQKWCRGGCRSSRGENRSIRHTGYPQSIGIGQHPGDHFVVDASLIGAQSGYCRWQLCVAVVPSTRFRAPCVWVRFSQVWLNVFAPQQLGPCLFHLLIL